MIGVVLGLSAEECARRADAEVAKAYAHQGITRAWHFGRHRGYLALAMVARGRHLGPTWLRDHERARTSAVPFTGSVEAWSRRATERGRRTLAGAYASGLFSVWLVHPDAVPCANCDLPVVPTIEDHALCGDHGVLCSAECRAEMCRAPECRDPEEYR